MIGDREVAGWRRGRYPVFFVARFSRPFDSSGTIDKGGWVGWDEGGEVTVSFGLSFVDEDGARRNLEAEAPDFDFDAMRAETRDGVEPRAVEDPRERRLRARPEVVLHGALPLAAPSEHVHRRGRPLPRHGRPDPRGEGPDPVLELLVLGPLQVVAPADRDDPAGALSATCCSACWPTTARAASSRAGRSSRSTPTHMSGDPAIPMVADGVCRGLVKKKDARRAVRRRQAPRHAARPGAAPARLAAGPPGHDARVRRRRLRARRSRAPARQRRRGRASTCSAR